MLCACLNLSLRVEFGLVVSQEWLLGKNVRTVTSIRLHHAVVTQAGLEQGSVVEGQDCDPAGWRPMDLKQF